MAFKNVLRLIEYDTSSVTGSNLREIMLLTNKNHIYELSPEDAELIHYKEIPDTEKWRIQYIKELIDVKCGMSELNGFTKDEIESMIKFLSCD